MNITRWRQIEDLFHIAVLLTAEARNCFLIKVCREDQELKEELSTLLAAAEVEDDFLIQSARRISLSLLASRDISTTEASCSEEQAISAGKNQHN